MKIAELWVASPTWWLESVTEHEFRDMFRGTHVVDNVELFRVPPSSDHDLFTNYLPHRVFRLLCGATTTRPMIETVALNIQLEDGNITIDEFMKDIR